jgi:nitrogen fixation protein FixH
MITRMAARRMTTMNPVKRIGVRFGRVRLWPGMVFGLIGLNFCVVAATVYAAHARRSAFAIETDYDRKALRWDDAARQLRTNAQLGWSVRVDSVEGGRLRISLLDRDGHGLDGADVRAEVFHHARAGDRVVAALAHEAGGRYAAGVRIATPGLWELRFEVRRGADVFTATVTRAVMGGGA